MLKSPVAAEPELQKVVILGGMPRSGTNLARRLIGSHSAVAMSPVEFNIPRRLASGHSLRTLLTEQKFVDRYGIDVSDLHDAPPDVAYRELLVRYARQVSKPIAGEKSPRNELFYPDIESYLPGSDVFFIQMVRNPFDVIASFKNAPFRGNLETDTDTIETIAMEWVESVSLGAARAAIYPHRYRLCLFEALTTRTEEVVSELCEFLELPNENDRMQAFSDFESAGDNTSFKAERGTADDDRSKVKKLASRKSHLTEQEVDIVGSICGKLGIALGYEDQDFEHSQTVRSATGPAPGKLSTALRRIFPSR